MEKEPWRTEYGKIMAIILGLVGLVLLSLTIISGLTVIYDKIHYAHWESNMPSIDYHLASAVYHPLPSE